jgi:CRISPR-associated protein Cas1
MGTVVTGQSVWFTDHRRMVHVDSADLVPEKLAAIVSEARDAVTGSVSPPVLEDDSRCRGCSQVQVCLPSEELASSPKIVPRHTDGVPLYVHEQGGYVFWKRGRVYVRKRNGSEESFPVETIDHLAIVGDVSITTAVLRELPARGKPVLMCTYGGRCISYVSAMERPNGLARVRLATLSENIRYRIASELVRAKVGNQATVLARNQDGRSVAKRIREIRDSIRPELNNLPPDTDPAGYLFSVEGGCADLYFPTYRRSVSAPGDPDSWKRGDKRTNPDELNSALNFGYALLRAAVSRSILGCGLDPVDGTLHTPSRNKPALTLDIMEQFRAPLIDAVIRSGFNRRELSEKDFISLGGSSRLTESGRRTVVSLFGDALLRENTYLGRAMTWRRTLDYQARALVKVCDGTMPVYRGVHTR